MAKRTGLGKGLDALFLDNQTGDSGIQMLKLSEIEPNRNQPRRNFDEASLLELADSIRNHGILQPLVVRPIATGGYQIVAGERRWRASRMAGKTEIPVIIRELSDSETMEIAIIENLQREDLNVVELAFGYRSLMEDFNMTQEQVALKVGKSRPVVANTIRLLNLPEEALDLLKENKLTQGHARALLAIDEEELLLQIARKAASGELLVRDIEKLAKLHRTPAKPKEEKPEAELHPMWGDSFHREMELALATELGRKVIIQSHGKKSTITLEFYNDEELADIAARLAKTSY